MDRSVAFFGWQQEEQGLLLWLVYFSIAFLGSQLVASPRRIGQLSLAILAGATYVAALGVSEVLGARPTTMFTLETMWMLSRGMSTMMNPDFLGNFLVIPAVLGIAVAAGCQGRDRVVAVAGTAIVALGLVLTLVRGAWIGLFVGLVALSVLVVAVGWATHRKPVAVPSNGGDPFGGAGYCPSGGKAVKPDVRAIALLWLTLALVLVVATVASPSISSLTERFVDPIEDSGRLPLWQESIAAANQRWLLGAGPDNFVYAWQEQASETTARSNGVTLVLDSSHNLYIDLVVQFGYPFVLVAVAGIIWLCVRAVRSVAPAVAQGRTHGWEVLGVVAATLAMGASFVVGMSIVPILVTFFAVLGMLMGIDARPVQGEPRRAVTGAALGLSVLAALVFGTWSSLSGVSAIVGNQMAPNYVVRAERNLAALKVAPWRIYPQVDLVDCAVNLMPPQQQMLGLDPETAYRRLLENEPLKALHQYNYGDYLLLVNGDAQAAYEYAERALELQPVYAPALMLRGDALIAMGEWEQGLADLAEAVRLESLSRVDHSWDGPWAAYLNALVADGKERGNGASLEQARSTLEAFRVRFPTSTFTTQIELMLSSDGSGMGGE